MLKSAKGDRNSVTLLLQFGRAKTPPLPRARAAEIKNWQQRQQAYQNARRWADRQKPAALAGQRFAGWWTVPAR